MAGAAARLLPLAGFETSRRRAGKRQMKTNAATTILLFIAATLSAALVARADTVSVTNNVNSSASTGGNSAAPGQVIEGNGSASVRSTTVINGETVDDFSQTQTGANASVSHAFTYSTSTNSAASVNIRAGANAPREPLGVPLREANRNMVSSTTAGSPAESAFAGLGGQATATASTTTARPALYSFGASIGNFFSGFFKHVFDLFKF